MRTLRAAVIHLAYAQPTLRPHLLPLLKVASVVTPLYGHNGPESAYVVEDYPYSFKLRTTIRYWLESSPSKGFRFVSQTKDPKTGQWNKPKASTYVPLVAAMYLDEKGHVQWTGLGTYSEPVEIIKFLNDFPKIDRKPINLWVRMKVKFYEKLLGANAEGRSGWAINNVPQAATDADVKRNQASLEAWTEVLKKV
jgi:hypothetical protein